MTSNQRRFCCIFAQPKQSKNEFMSQHILASSFQNAILNRKESLKIPKTKTNQQILDLLQKEGFVKNYSDNEDDKFSVQVFLRFARSQKVAKGSDVTKYNAKQPKPTQMRSRRGMSDANGAKRNQTNPLRSNASNQQFDDRDLQLTLKGFKAVSKPSLQIYSPYLKFNEFPLLKSCHFGLLLVSTSEGILSHLEAQKRKLGGQILYFVY